MLRRFALNAALAAMVVSAPAFAAEKLGCAQPDPQAASAGASAPVAKESVAATTGPKVVFQLNRAEDASTILRFVTNYLAAEPSAQVAVVGYADGANFLLKGAADANGKLYEEQLAALAARGVAFKVCGNTLRARSLTAEAVSPSAAVVPGAVNEIIRLQTREGYAHFQN